jgi:MoxR-like ATPase
MSDDEGYRYDPIFKDSDQAAPTAALETVVGDHVPVGGYLLTAQARLAVDVALAAGRPLLVQGQPGCGKTMLALAVAQRAHWDFHSATVTSRTRAQDLQWTFDAVRRLRDAQAGLAGRWALDAVRRADAVRRRVGTPTGSRDRDELRPYIRPGVFWRALAPMQAAAFTGEPAPAPRERAVLLLDEIDKAEPDVPNDLLGPLGTLSFEVTDLDGYHVRNERPENPPLVVLTTNDERELPPAFLRRCVVYTMEFPDEERLVAIGRRHFPDGPQDLLREVATITCRARDEADAASYRPPGTAEYIDAVGAAIRLGVTPTGSQDAWSVVRRLTLAKWDGPDKR